MSAMNYKKKIFLIGLYTVFLLILPTFMLLLIIFGILSLIINYIKKKHKLKPNIIFGPQPLLNYKYYSSASKKYGYNTLVVVYDLYKITSPSDFDIVLKFTNNYIIHWAFIAIISYFVFLLSLVKFDIYFYSFDGGLLMYTPLRRLEYQILKFLRKKIIVNPYGADITVPKIIEKTYKNKRWNISMFIKEDYPNINEKEVLDNIKYTLKYADCIFTGNDSITATLLRRDVILTNTLPIDLKYWKPKIRTNNKKIRIAHAPNHRAIKGTEYVIKVCEELKKEGYPIELVIVEKMENKKAKKIYETADIIVDQLIIGWYGLFAIEGMALGKPVICYLYDELKEKVDYAKELPLVSANPDNLKEVLIKLIRNKKLRIELGKRGREFVEKYHSERFIGKILDEIYKKVWFGDKA